MMSELGLCHANQAPRFLWITRTWSFKFFNNQPLPDRRNPLRHIITHFAMVPFVVLLNLLSLKGSWFNFFLFLRKDHGLTLIVMDSYQIEFETSESNFNSRNSNNKNGPLLGEIIWANAPEPKYVIVMGACTLTRGMLRL